jgi:hypothetical protein
MWRMRRIRLTQSRRQRGEQQPDAARGGGNLRCEPVYLLRLRQGKHPAPRSSTCRRSRLWRRARMRRWRPWLRPRVCRTRVRAWLWRWWLSRLRPWLWWLRRLRWLLLVDRGRQGLLDALTLRASVLSDRRTPSAAQESVPGERQVEYCSDPNSLCPLTHPTKPIKNQSDFVGGPHPCVIK